MADKKKVVKVEEPKVGSKEARIAELRDNPNRQPADDKELDLLLNGAPVAAVEPVVEAPESQSGITTTKDLGEDQPAKVEKGVKAE